MNGEIDLNKMLATLSPELRKGSYVFCCLDNPKDERLHLLNPLATFAEAEGLTVVINKDIADNLQIDYDGEFSCISLMVHSSLHAVGLTAAVSRVLSEVDISANIIAAYYHDHVFVPKEKTHQALDTLKSLASNSPISP